MAEGEFYWSARQVAEPEFSSPEDIVFGQEIGKSLLGTVRVAKHKFRNSKLYAVKMYNINDLEGDYLQLVTKEVHNMKILDHSKLLPIIVSFVSEYRIYIITPLMSLRSVSQLIESGNHPYRYGIPEVAIAMIVTDVVEALAYLHNRNLIHRAVKASHILFSETGNVVLAGFRYMLLKTQSAPLHVNDLDVMGHNLHWLSPEMLNQDYGGYSENSDVFSLGMTILEMGNGIAALDPNTPSMSFLKKVECESPALMDMHNSYEQEMQKYENAQQAAQASGSGDPDNRGPEMKRKRNNSDRLRDMAFSEKEYRPEIKDFLASCLIVERSRRPDIETLKKHKFLKIHSKTSRILLLTILGEQIEFGPQHRFPSVQPNEVAQLSWNFNNIDLNETS